MRHRGVLFLDELPEAGGVYYHPIGLVRDWSIWETPDDVLTS